MKFTPYLHKCEEQSLPLPLNIAEGYGRKTVKDRVHFLYIARGSIYELEAQLITCVDLGYLTRENITPVLQLEDKVSRMLMGLIKKYESIGL